MRILTALTYYRPHTSGLTIYAERLARALVRLGHEVTVLTMQYEKQLPREEIQDGVRIIRAPVIARVSKGVLAPTFGFLATKLAFSSDVLHLHLPQFDAAGVALRGRLFRIPTIITYHCDIQMPPGILNQAASTVIHLMDNIAGTLAHRVVTYTKDYGDNSPYLRRFIKKRAIIPPPVELPMSTPEAVRVFRDRFIPSCKRPVIAMAARFASEKGVEVLLDAFPRILDSYTDATILFAGQFENVLGEAEYFSRLQPRIQELESKGQWRFLGVLNMEEMAAFYPNIDLLVVPSLNSTESFGLVQIEAMMHGVPVVASDLPGVRYAVQSTGMGEIAPIGDGEGLAVAACKVLNKFLGKREPRNDLIESYSPLNTARQYEQLYRETASTIR